MAGKKTGTRFTIQFNRENPAHIQAAEILNSQGERGKAQYIARAVLHYESCCETPEAKHQQMIDEKTIEAVVERILLDRDDGVAKPSADIPGSRQGRQQGASGDIACDGTVEDIGKDGRDAIAGTMKAFRMK